MENNNNAQFGRNHAAPKEYTYFIKCAMDSEFLSSLNSEGECAGNYLYYNGIPIFNNGINKINKFDIWVINQEKQGFQYLWFKSKAEARELLNIIMAKKKQHEKEAKNCIFKYSAYNGWQNTNKYDSRNESELIGKEYHNYLKLIQKDIDNFQKYIEFLKSIGEGSHSLNYLLSGPPGTGKTTLIKVLASIYNCPIYIVNASVMGNINASTVLNPKDSTNRLKIILFEDFDRYLKEGKFVMSDILNELDGIESSNNCIRFFTANDEEVIYKFDALVNRMNSKFVYHNPTKDDFKLKLLKLLTFHEGKQFDENKINQLLDAAVEKKITLRPFTNYVIRYLFDDDVIDKLIEHLDELK